MWLVGRQGELVVQPGARIELDCVYGKSSGTPEWSWANASKEYATGRHLLDREYIVML